MWSFLWTLLLSFSHSVGWYSDYKHPDYNGMVLLSIPKSGTFFVKNFVENLLTKECPHVHPHLFNGFYTHNGAFVKPMELFFSSEEFLDIHSQTKIIFLYRDLRDLLVSYLRWVDQLPRTEAIFKLYGHPEWDHWTVERKLCELIEGAQFPLLQEDIHSIREIWKTFPGKSNVMIIKFEDIIGPLANGNEELQFNTLFQLYCFLDENACLDRLSFENVVRGAWGGSITFNSPYIGRWRSFFTEVVELQFKNSLWNDLLIELGYEQEVDWAGID